MDGAAVYLPAFMSIAPVRIQVPVLAIQLRRLIHGGLEPQGKAVIADGVHVTGIAAGQERVRRRANGEWDRSETSGCSSAEFGKVRKLFLSTICRLKYSGLWVLFVSCGSGMVRHSLQLPAAPPTRAL